VVTKTPEQLSNLKRTVAQVAQRYCWFVTLQALREQDPLRASGTSLEGRGRVRFCKQIVGREAS